MHSLLRCLPFGIVFARRFPKGKRKLLCKALCRCEFIVDGRHCDGFPLLIAVWLGRVDIVYAPHKGVRVVGKRHDCLVAVVAHDGKAVNFILACPLSVRQPKPASDGLLCERFGGRSPKRDDGIEVGDIPAFLQHIHMNNNLDAVVGILQR